MPYVIADWKEIHKHMGCLIEMAVFKAEGQCVAMSPPPQFRVSLRGNVTVIVEAPSQHKARSICLDMIELYC